MYWFTADEHYGHANIIKYCNRPFKSVEEMDLHIMFLHNEMVGKNDVVIHAGDFCWCNNMRDMKSKYLQHLNGTHVFIRGSHDHWMPDSWHWMWTKTIEGVYVVVCHYAMRVWPRSHYGSIQLYAHSHNRLESIGKQHDIGVDGNNFYPYPWKQIVEIMSTRDDNPNLVRK
jgi:calcineurin-like phosphoesterase family protein